MPQVIAVHVEQNGGHDCVVSEQPVVAVKSEDKGKE